MKRASETLYALVSLRRSVERPLFTVGSADDSWRLSKQVCWLVMMALRSVCTSSVSKSVELSEFMEFEK